MFAGWYLLLFCFLAFLIYLFHGPLWLTIVSGIVLAVNFWFWGILHNFQFKPHDLPRSWRNVHLLSSLAGVLLLLWGIVAYLL